MHENNNLYNERLYNLINEFFLDWWVNFTTQETLETQKF